MSIAAGSERARRIRRLAPVVVLVLVLVAAYLVSRGTQRSYLRITEDGAVSIAQRQPLELDTRRYTLRLIPEGVPPRRTWVVSFCLGERSVVYGKLGVVLIDANSGKVRGIRRCR